MSFYKTEIGEPPTNAVGAPTGEYEFTITATRKFGDFAPVVVTWTADVEINAV